MSDRDMARTKYEATFGIYSPGRFRDLTDRTDLPPDFVAATLRFRQCLPEECYAFVYELRCDQKGLSFTLIIALGESYGYGYDEAERAAIEKATHVIEKNAQVFKKLQSVQQFALEILTHFEFATRVFAQHFGTENRSALPIYYRLQ